MPEPPGGGAGLDDLARRIAALMTRDPSLAARIADVLEDVGKGVSQVENAGVSQGAALAAQAPVDEPAPQQAVDPLLAARLEQIEQALADQEVDRELSRLMSRYNDLRHHFGGVLPEALDDKAVLQKAYDVMAGKVSPFGLALAAYILEQVTSGEGTLRDRILASAAQQAHKPPAVEGRGGGVAAGGEELPKAKNASDLMRLLRKGAEAFFKQQAGV
ncbi:MAG: hypothetical protein ACUVRO_13385 [Armatimonadota bacterium]